MPAKLSVPLLLQPQPPLLAPALAVGAVVADAAVGSMPFPAHLGASFRLALASYCVRGLPENGPAAAVAAAVHAAEQLAGTAEPPQLLRLGVSPPLTCFWLAPEDR